MTLKIVFLIICIIFLKKGEGENEWISYTP
jgi:hypothetical protein